MFTKTVSVKLSVPLKWEDRDISVLDLDFGKVNGGMLKKCERDTSGNLTAVMRPLSLEYTSMLASMISDVPLKAIEKFNFEDYELVCTVVQKYLTKEDPQEYYDSQLKENMGFTKPAEVPEPLKLAEDTTTS